MTRVIMLRALVLAFMRSAASVDDAPEQAANTWLKRSPMPDAPASPRMGYEAPWGYDPAPGCSSAWAESRAAGLKGNRVYRLDGPFDVSVHGYVTTTRTPSPCEATSA